MNGAILTLTTEPDRVESICEMATGLWGRTVVEVRDDSRADVALEIYFDSAVEAELAARALPADMTQTMAIREFEPEEWTESWKRHFQAMDIGDRLRVTPPWMASTKPHPSGRMELIIDPGLSFGTGNHFTTRFCLRQLDRLAPRVRGATFLDIGTGSGILAIAAARLGASRAVGWDFDPVCVKQAAENARINGVSTLCSFLLRDITAGFPDGTDDLVCANLYSSLLIEHASSLLNRTREYLMISGLRRTELDAVSDAFARLGAREESRDHDSEWGGLVFHATTG
ncbi:MAG: 50S ribosomal protein L11 methyltransferase [Kiritimatiellia bacterium]|nr:50S ribosomal protein L11 methyltransferase [Kiritimatiellia bacterium]